MPALRNGDVILLDSGDMVRWQGEAGELTGTIARFSQYRAEVVTDGGSLFPRINQLVKVA